MAKALHLVAIAVFTLAVQASPSLKATRASDVKPHALDTNSAFLFIKPTAVSSKVIKFVKKELKSAGLKVGREGTIDAHQISELEIIDNHYREISMLAMRTFPAEIQVTADAKAKFKAAFSEDWEVAIRAGRVLNVASALKTMDAKALALRWDANERYRVKLASGTYVEKIDEDGTYVVNGFYAAMRAEYVAAGNKVHWMIVSWNRNKISWEKFRSDVLGVTDPAKAAAGSLRAQILKQWKQLELSEMPTVQDNSVHASAGPVEAMRERITWGVVRTIQQDPFGSAMIKHGANPRILQVWMNNPPAHHDGVTDSVFDMTENKDSIDVLNMMLKIQEHHGEQMKRSFETANQMPDLGGSHGTDREGDDRGGSPHPAFKQSPNRDDEL